MTIRLRVWLIVCHNAGNSARLPGRWRCEGDARAALKFLRRSMPTHEFEIVEDFE